MSSSISIAAFTTLTLLQSSLKSMIYLRMSQAKHSKIYAIFWQDKMLVIYHICKYYRNILSIIASVNICSLLHHLKILQISTLKFRILIFLINFFSMVNSLKLNGIWRLINKIESITRLAILWILSEDGLENSIHYTVNLIEC